MWGGFVEWYKYMRNYKTNKNYDAIKEQECVAKDNEIERLKKVLDERTVIGKEKDNLIKILLDRLDSKNQQLSDAKKELQSKGVKKKSRKSNTNV